MISTITSTQVHKQMSPIVRKSMTHLFILQIKELWRFRSNRRIIECDL